MDICSTLEQQKEFITLVDNLLELTKKIVEIKVDFMDEINKFPRLKDKNLQFFYSKIPSKDKKVMIESNLQGEIKYIKVFEENKSLFFKIDYKIKEGNRINEYNDIDIFKFKIEDNFLRKFIKFSVLNYKKKFSKGNILDRLLKIPVPFFDKNEEKNNKIIQEVMNPYLKIMENHYKLEEDIFNIENSIDQKIYELYKLDNEEIEYIEFAFGSESKILHLL